MPLQARAEMQEQSLRRFDAAKRRPFVNAARSRSRIWPRIVVLGGSIAITAGATFEMWRSLALGGTTPLEALIIVLFALNIGWIALTFVSAAAGAFIILTRRSSASADAPLKGRTAVLMPTYNESPERIFAAIEAMASGVRTLGENAAFDWFILSDTTNPSIALAEEAALVEMRARLGEATPIYYRRRRRNIARKAGNIADFCRRWSGAYDYLIILDADSLMEPESIVELARRMEADPDAGLIQTVPRLVHGRTAFARLQQFAGRIYGPVIATGLAWWAGSEGNYWGHNAIIRRRAFTEAAGLPTLPGKPPFGGHILSHDFVEAALIRRAGWTVRIAADIDGSYEEAPPSIIDFAARDRRWCQGNLQHARVVTARGLHWVSRFHLVSGIFSYAASLLWLLLILAGLGLAIQATFIPPDYFEDPYALFPTWPRIDSALQIELLTVTLFLLIGPKLFGLATAILSPDLRRKCGGALRLVASFLAETAISALMAPIMMLIQSWVIVAIIAGADAGWAAQRREHGKLPVKDALKAHRWHMATGLGLAVAAWMVEPMMLAWLSLAIVGLLLAAPISSLTASLKAGKTLRHLGLLIIPEERARPTIGRATSTCRPRHRAIVSATPDMRGMVADSRRRRHHLALLDAAEEEKAGEVDPLEAVTAEKIRQAQSLDEAFGYLRPDELAITLAKRTLFDSLSMLAPDRVAANGEGIGTSGNSEARAA
jgi:membrane glycosyltransferase